MHIAFTQWEKWASSGAFTLLPYIYTSELERDFVPTWEPWWEASGAYAFVLESGKGGRYSYFGKHPSSMIKGKDHMAEMFDLERDLTSSLNGKPLELVRDWMKPYRSPILPEIDYLAGGCVGYWGYDVIRSIERLPVQTVDDLPCPDYCFMRFNELWVIDHQLLRLHCVIHAPVDGAADDRQALREKYRQAEIRAEQMEVWWRNQVEQAASFLPALERIERFKSSDLKDKLAIDVDAIPRLRADFKKEDYIRAVHKIQDYIRQGDTFQVNLSVRQSIELLTSPEQIYEWLRLLNPSPYMGFLRFPGMVIASASPELLVKLKNRTVSARPIAGTRPRGQTSEEDLELSGELLANEKERAEHIMLVDLERNDLGRISKFGTVRVKDFMVVEYYSHVMHIVSEVEGELAEGKDSFDVIGSVFPGGTITGAPKIRTMEIIEELEPVRRGPYTGSIGWIDYNGNMEFNIIIRTMVATEGIGYVQAGAGIVIDSVPEKEYTESLNKAKAVWKAIQYSEMERSAFRGSIK